MSSSERVRELLAELRRNPPPDRRAVLSEKVLEEARQEARQVLDALPKDGIYWHGRDGKPCACPGCVAAALVGLDEAGLLERDVVELRKRRRTTDNSG